MPLLTTFPNIFLECFSTLTRFRELPWRYICHQMSQNYLNMSVWIRRFYSKLWKVCEPSSPNNPCSCLPASSLPLCSQGTLSFQVLSCSGAFARGVFSASSDWKRRQWAFSPQTWRKPLKSVEIFSSIDFAGCLITRTRLPLFNGIRSSFGVSPFGIPSKCGMTGMFPLFLCFWSAQFLHDLVLQNWGLPILGI